MTGAILLRWTGGFTGSIPTLSMVRSGEDRPRDGRRLGVVLDRLKPGYIGEIGVPPRLRVFGLPGLHIVQPAQTARQFVSALYAVDRILLQQLHDDHFE